MRVFLAGPYDRPDDEARLRQLAEVVKAAGHAPSFPEGDAWLENASGADAVVALIDGAEPTAEVAFAMGLAYARGLPVLGLRSDTREPAGGRDARLYHEGVREFATGDWKALESALFGFLTNPPQRKAELLVRDRVPTRMRQEGAAFELRRAEGSQHATSIKRRVVLEAERLLGTPEGDEREAMAELLELVETLLEIRHYDPTSLRRAKERLEAEDGAYAQGYLIRDRRE